MAHRTCSVKCHDIGKDEDKDDSTVHTGVLTPVDTISLAALEEMHFDTVGPSLHSPQGPGGKTREPAPLTVGTGPRAWSHVPVSSSNSHSCPGTGDQRLHPTEEKAKVHKGRYL